MCFQSKNFLKKSKISAQSPELIEKNFFPEKLPRKFLWTRRRQFWHSCRNNWASPKSFFAQHLNWLKEFHFSNTKFILKRLLKTATLQHLQPCQKITRKFWEKFTESPKMRDKQNFRKNWIFIRMFLSTRRVQFGHTFWNTLVKYQRLVSSISEKIERISSFPLFQKVHLDTQKATSTTPLKVFDKNWKKFCQNSEK